MSAELERLRQQIAKERESEANVKREAANLVSRLRNATSAVHSACAAALNKDLETYRSTVERIQPFSVAPWESPAWNGYSDLGGFSLPLRLRVGSNQERSVFGETPADLPYMLPVLDANGALILDCDAETRDTARKLIVNLVLRSALSAPRQIRFTLLDPIGLGDAFRMRALLPPPVRPPGRNASEELSDVVQDIRRTSHDVVQQAARLLDVPAEKRAADPFEIIAVMDFPEAYRNDPRAIDYILLIANSGPRAGRHILLEYRHDKELPRDFKMDHFANASIIDCARLNFRLDPPPSPLVVEDLLKAAVSKKTQVPVGTWESAVRPPKFFQECSRDQISTKLGESVQFWLGQQGVDRVCSHAMIAGQGGSGKSSLLHVLITGLAARYSSDELRFVLVDGKRGVEFQLYRHFPHADVVCLETSPAIALSVLEEFHAEMDARFALLREEGLSDLIVYRKKTGRILPRKIMVVDEYSVLLEADPTKAGNCLKQILEKGRAAGMHLVLSAHNFDVPLMPSDFGQHIQFVASLFLSPDEIQRAPLLQAEAKRMLRDLTAGGQVLVNDKSGNDGHNSRGAVARLEPSDNRPEAVGRIVGSIGQASTSNHRPIVLNGNECATLSDNPFVTRWNTQPPDAATLEETARCPVAKDGFGIDSWIAADQPLPLWLGRKFDVRGHAVAVLRRVPGHNLLSIGQETVYRLSMLGNALAGLRSMIPLGNLEILFLDGQHPARPGAGIIRSALRFVESAGARVTSVENGDPVAHAMQEFAADRRSESRLLIISEPEYFPELYHDGFGPPSAGPARILRDILKTGPQTGSRVIVTASSLQALATVLHPTRESGLFTHRVVQQMSANDSTVLFESMAASQIQTKTNHVTAALYVDSVQDRAGQLFKSYWIGRTVNSQSPADGFQRSLVGIFGPQQRGASS